jgi:hypothetical protein
MLVRLHIIEETKGGLEMILNCTPHNVVVMVGGEEIVIPASGYLLRASTKEEEAGWITYQGRNIPVVKQTLGELKVFTKDGRELSKGEIKDLFKDVEAVIVPTLLANYKQQFYDLIGRVVLMYSPNTAKAIRDEAGRIKAVPSLVYL